ncbi:hypothetical protein GPECTOR_33g633 [Gonium pectorale]|uniref:Alpha-glucan water dikinase phosphohistidine-like domain-containing protein n=1 Tax=Gonium pectorale TaxID=33097 RepID=A0A150GD20_GONPE|nr:hypothetical protein GPECTOR_33g633 [Gonium pectorale]|eukprot:KXZ47751.1 hypothetical protein GPECTOR_33g633 [Gonium pectorale]
MHATAAALGGRPGALAALPFSSCASATALVGNPHHPRPAPAPLTAAATGAATAPTTMTHIAAYGAARAVSCRARSRARLVAGAFHGASYHHNGTGHAHTHAHAGGFCSGCGRPMGGPNRAVASDSAAAPVGDGLDGGGGGSAFMAVSGPESFLDAPTAEVRMSTASERAAAGSAVGPAAAARMQADCIRAVRAWCKLGYGDHIVVHVEHQQLASSSTPGLLTSAAATFSGPDGRRHAAVAVAVGIRCADAGAAAAKAAAASPPPSPGRAPPPLAAPGSSAPTLDPLPGLSLHWGTCHAQGQRWYGPGPGWHTRPPVSYDAGRGAWQTPLALRQAIPLEEEQAAGLNGVAGEVPETAEDSTSAPRVAGDDAPAAAAAELQRTGGPWVAAYSVLLQVPWEGAVRNGGICFVLKTARNQWIKARASPLGPGSAGGGGRGNGGNGGGGETDFWLGTAGLPLVAHGTPLLPDVFRMSTSDSLPQVVHTQPGPDVPVLSNGNGNGHANGNGNGNAGANGHSPGRDGGIAVASDIAPLSAGPAADIAAAPATPVASAHASKAAPPAKPQGKPAAAAAEAAAAVPDAGAGAADLLTAAAAFLAPPRHSDVLLRPAERHPLPGGGGGRPVGHCDWMVEQIVQREPGAERSLMHRYNTGAELVGMAAGSAEVEGALAAVTAWLRMSSARLLVWNRNYNVKPREISTAQARLAAALASLGAARGPAAPGGRGGAGVDTLVRVALAAGGMMEEWHQKLHNNTSPDDVVICRALLDYIAAGLDITAYWRTLSAAGITAQRLASFDRPIVSEPRFSGAQAAGLQRDLAAYLQTLQAVHGGDDLRSAVSNVLGYEETDMKGKHIVVPPVPGVATPAISRHLRSLLALQKHLAAAASRPAGQQAAAGASAAAAAARRALAPHGSTTAAGSAAAAPPAWRPTDVSSLSGLPGAIRLMEMLLEGRHLLRPFLDGGEAACGGRLLDVAFLDLALDSALRTAVEAHMGAVRAAVADGTAALEVMRLAVENAALSSTPNDDLVYSNKWLRLLVAQEDPRDARDRMLQTLAICDRVKRALADGAAALMGMLQPPAAALADKLRLPAEAVAGLGEEAVRGSSGAPLAQLLAALEPALRRATGGGVWQIVSRGTDRPVLAGRLRVEPRLAAVQHERMSEPTVLLVEGITGAEEIPEGCVAVLVGSAAEGGGGGCPDVLSHSAVRARNMGVLLAGCYSPELVSKMRSHAGSRVMVRLEGSEITISFSSGGTAGSG